MAMTWSILGLTGSQLNESGAIFHVQKGCKLNLGERVCGGRRHSTNVSD